jgi:hypothetical protein
VARNIWIGTTMAARRDRSGLTAKESKIVSKKSRLFDSKTQGIGLPQKSSKATITGRKPGKPKPTAGKGLSKNVITTGGKAGRAIENKMRSEMKIPKLATTGMRKAPAKVQKGLDKTINRVPTLNVKSSFSKDKVVVDDNQVRVTARGSNKAAAKGNAPKRTPGVKKNTSLQRSINNSNKNLKDLKKPRGGMGGGGLFGGGAIRKSR